MRIAYALAKQLDRAHTLETDYGSLSLDEDMRKAIDKALRPLLEKRLKTLQKMTPKDTLSTK